MAEKVGGLERIKRSLERVGATCQVSKLPAPIRSATAIECEVAQIAHSIVFRGGTTDRPILVIVGSRDRVSEEKVQAPLAEPISKADADFVRRRTGFAIGGVPPVGHSENIAMLLDESLSRFDTVWAAAGTPHAVFKTTFAELKRWTGGRVGDFKAQARPNRKRHGHARRPLAACLVYGTLTMGLFALSAFTQSWCAGLLKAIELLDVQADATE